MSERKKRVRDKDRERARRRGGRERERRDSERNFSSFASSEKQNRLNSELNWGSSKEPPAHVLLSPSHTYTQAQWAGQKECWLWTETEEPECV